MTVPDSDLVNLDMTIARFIAPRIRAFRERNTGHPFALTDEAWDAALADIAFAFERITNDCHYGASDKATSDRVERGLTLFSKHLQDLWI